MAPTPTLMPVIKSGCKICGLLSGKVPRELNNPAQVSTLPEERASKFFKRKCKPKVFLQSFHTGNTAHIPRANHIRDMNHLIGTQNLIFALNIELDTAQTVARNLHRLRVQDYQVHNLTTPIGEHPNESVAIQQHRSNHAGVKSLTGAINIRLLNPSRFRAESGTGFTLTIVSVNRQRGNSVRDKRHGSEHRIDLEHGFVIQGYTG